MRKTLEDSMQEILESMLGVCLEYADDRADGVYLWVQPKQACPLQTSFMRSTAIFT